MVSGLQLTDNRYKVTAYSTLSYNNSSKVQKEMKNNTTFRIIISLYKENAIQKIVECKKLCWFYNKAQLWCCQAEAALQGGWILSRWIIWSKPTP